MCFTGPKARPLLLQRFTTCGPYQGILTYQLIATGNKQITVKTPDESELGTRQTQRILTS